MRSLSVLSVAAILVAACGDTTDSESAQPDAATSTPTPTAAESTPETSTEDPTGPTPTQDADPTPEPTGSDPTTGSSEGSPDRSDRSDSSTTTTTTSPSTATPTPTSDDDAVDAASGSGTMRLDGTTYDLDVLACGWTHQFDDELAPEPGARDEFQVAAIALESDGLMVLDVSRDGDVGVVYPSVSWVGTDTQFAYTNEEQLATLVSLDGPRVTTDEPLRLLELIGEAGSGTHELSFDLTCDSYGGSTDPEIFPLLVAGHLGVEYEGPAPEGAGTLTVDGATYDLEVEECDRDGELTEVRAANADGSVRLSFTDHGPGSVIPDIVLVRVEGGFREPSEDVDIVRDGDTLTPTRPVPLRRGFPGEPAGTATFSVTCV